MGRGLVVVLVVACSPPPSVVDAGAGGGAAGGAAGGTAGGAAGGDAGGTAGGAAGGSAGGTSGGAAGPSCPGCTVIRHVKVFDADGPRLDRRVSMLDGGIVADEPDDGGTVANAALELDGGGATLIPGLWDAHAHVMVSVDGYSFQYMVAEAIKGFVYAGVTSVVDMGGNGATMVSMRDRVNRGEVIGPHLYVAGRFVQGVGGHPCGTEWTPTWCSPVGAGAPASTVVGNIAALNPDFIKVIIEGSGSSRLPAADIVAATGAAHARSLRVAAHVSALADLDDALDAGVDILAHVPPRSVMSDAEADVIAARGMPIVTTYGFWEAIAHLVDTPTDFDLPLVVDTVPASALTTVKNRRASLVGSAPQSRTWVANLNANVAKLKARNALLVAGSDCGNFAVFHGYGLIHELALLVAAGLTTREAITAATASAAQMMGQGAVVGRVRAGMRADLVLVPGDVEADIKTLESVSEVFLAGVRVNRPNLLVTQQRTRMVPNIVNQAPDVFCVDDFECGLPYRCHDTSRICAIPCQVADAGTVCPTGSGCAPKEGSTTFGWCEPSEGCNALAQDCPFTATYASTCVPVTANVTHCRSGGAVMQGASCATNRCAMGLVCSDQLVCRTICDPSNASCPGVTACMDLSSRYGQTVGLCQ